MNMANTKVEFSVKTGSSEQDLYVVGNVSSLGAWDVSKAVKLELCAECGCFTAAKMLPAGEIIEFKVLSGKDWGAVEKGIYGEDVQNHTFVASKGVKVEIEVPAFGK